MSRWARRSSIYVSVFLMGSLAPIVAGRIASASAATLPSRPVVWVSGQDSGQVFVVDTASGTFKNFDFAHGGGSANPATPAVPGIGGPTPGLDVASPKPHLITFSPDARIAYVSLQNTNPGVFAAIDVQTFAVHTFPMPATGTPANEPSKVTEVKASPDGTVLFVGEIGNDKGSKIGRLTKITTDEPTNPTNPTFTVATSTTVGDGNLPAQTGPACTTFSPDGTLGYVDSSLEPVKGVMEVRTSDLHVNAFVTTGVGDPQCGIHDPIVLNGVPTVVVTDNGDSVHGHVRLIDTTRPFGVGNFTEVAPSPIAAKNLHDNWPVQLEPAGAPTTDSANTVYTSDRDSTTLHQDKLGTTTDNVLTLNDPFTPATPAGFTFGTTFKPRSAPDTLDGSGDTVFIAMKEFGDLGIVDGFGTQSFIHLTDPDPTCGEVSNVANFHKCFTVHAVTVQPVKSFGNINVTAGSTLVLSNKKVVGSITVQPGGALVLDNTTVSGSVVANRPSSFRMCGSTTGGSVSVTGATGFVLVGDPADDGCPGNTIHGSLALRNNTHGVEALGNTVTTVFASGNSGTGPFPEDTAPDIQ